jgi:hypothetical protein
MRRWEERVSRNKRHGFVGYVSFVGLVGLLNRLTDLTVITGLTLLLAVSAHAACTQTLSAGANIGSAISAAAGGDTICLNDGTYNGITVTNVNKASMVTVQSVNGAANVNVGALSLNNASFIRIQGVSFGGGVLQGHHLELLNSIGVQRLVNGVSQILQVTGTVANAAILIDHINYSNIQNPCTNNACVEGRISVMDGGNPSGITISNSVFSGGNSDGIQVLGSPVGVQIIGNEFSNILASNGTHTDAIQTYYSGSGTVIKNNYIHDCETGIMAPDGGTNEQIIGNVFDLKGYPFDIVVNNWTGGTISHNTFKYGTTCSWNSCGTLWIQATTGLNVKDNIIGEMKLDSGSILEDYNLINVGGSAHGHTILGLPTYTGGSSPTTFAGFGLTAISRGHLAASDTTDMGANPSAAPMPRTCPPYPAFPDASCTGVLPGVTRTNSGSITTTSNGQVIQNLNVNGPIVVRHSNVTIRNVKVTNPGGVAISNIGCGGSCTNLLIEDVDLDGSGNTSGASAVDFDNYTLRRANIHQYGEGPGCGVNNVMEDNYMHDFTSFVAQGAHQDAIQCEDGNNNTVRHNTLLMNVNGGNSAIVFGGNSTNNTAEYNLVGGGGYTLYQGQAGGTFRHNRWTATPPEQFGPIYNANLDGPWTPEAPCDNLWIDGPNAGKAVADGGPVSCSGTPPPSVCDVNKDNLTNVSDVQLCVNQAIGTAACSTGDINKDSACNVVDVQRVVNGALGGTCVSP